MKCAICKEKIKEEEQVYKVILGNWKKDEFGGYGFEPVESTATEYYQHVKCT